MFIAVERACSETQDMADLPPDIMSMLSRGNLPDEDEFEDFMEQVSHRHHHSFAAK
jgi:hypothetical protein